MSQLATHVLPMKQLYSPVHDIEFMEMLQSKQQLRTIEPSTLFIEPSLSLQMVEELSAIHETKFQFLSVRLKPPVILERSR